jgi:hypothetical protein
MVAFALDKQIEMATGLIILDAVRRGHGTGLS